MPESRWITIDSQYIFPRFAASFLRVKNGRAVFIENNTNWAIPHLLEALDKAGSNPESVDFLLVTHAHLDHAGATGQLVKIFPRATVLAHPKAARVLQDPSRLIEGAKQVYGTEKYQALYGDILPVPPDRILSLAEGEIIEWEGEKIESFYTLGHASHHLCFFDLGCRSVFSGDAFGVSYPDLQGKTFFHIPSTSPVDFDSKRALEAIEAIERRNPERVFLTHFGEVGQVLERAKTLKALILLHEAVTHDERVMGIDDELTLKQTIKEKLKKIYQIEWEKCGMQSSLASHELIQLDLELNAAGLAIALLRRKRTT